MDDNSDEIDEEMNKINEPPQNKSKKLQSNNSLHNKCSVHLWLGKYLTSCAVFFFSNFSKKSFCRLLIYKLPVMDRPAQKKFHVGCLSCICPLPPPPGPSPLHYFERNIAMRTLGRVSWWFGYAASMVPNSTPLHGFRLN